MPSASVASPKLSRQVVKSKPIPQALTDGYYAIGTNTYLSEENTVWLNDEYRLRHMHIIGATGVGKSTFIANLFLQDCDAGNGCIVFDPHGDLVDDILPRIRKEDLDRVVLIDPSDTQFPIGFNLLEANTELEKIILSSDLVETFKRNSIAWGDTMSAVLTNAINAFLEANQGGTLLELRKFLLDAKYRNSILSHIEDLSVRSYWQYEFPELRKGALAPLLTRIDTFLRPKIVRNMMAQSKGLDFKEALADNKIILVKLSQGLIGEENSYLLGTLLLSKLYQAAQARQGISKDERNPYYLYIDEFHNFLTPSLSAILSGARKYGLGLILAHQELAQIQDTTIGNSVISNPSVRICFRVGDNDAQKLEKGFSYFDSNDLQNLSVGEAICRVSRNDWDFQMYTDDLPSADYDEANIDIVRDSTRAQYATPIEDIERLVNELYQFEPPTAKQKEPKPEKPVTVEKEKTEPVAEVSEPIIAKQEPAIDIQEASKKFLATAEKQREQREHLYMQDFVKKMAEQRGFKVELEAPANGGRIDILLIRNAVRIACELSVTNTIDYEVKNIKKCIEAGYANVVMLCSNEIHLRNIKQAASEGIDVEKIQFLNPEHLHLYLDTFAEKTNVKETRTRGYRVKTTYNVENENPGTDETVKNTLIESLKRKN
ncbi:MAG: type IV secretion system DNA-binding domain-containing protein [Sphingobacteriales bacterium JAD_PAG50586_3]|nr:MAG: type IV secretion system DNA-binding domain-containing protein [Sphingobacteriales bacterium JAD_PAG50586_3]